MKKRLLSSLLIAALLVGIFAISAFAASGTFSSSSLASGYGKTIFASKTMSKSTNVCITQDSATVISTTRDASVRYVLKRSDTGVEMDYDFLDGADEGTLTPIFNNVSSSLVAYNSESSSIKFAGSYSY